ncbi:MAG: right-handed parallel beta-helix repeat-containing protein [Planctomycetes bacterium]|nr:right-handed parallel beta-helix repeat-containing protein [Planctomycetota bacterium]MBL7143396.1 right-handed parallel beta-helix repeat-containing protein [Phycisphaerae bacterium]
MKRNNFFALAGGTLVLFLISFAGAANISKQVETTNIYLTVRDFGAVGDGEADDTQAFQRAVDSGRGDVYVPRGTYRLTKTIVVDLNRIGPVSIVGSGTAKLIMTGPGPALRLIGTHKGTADPGTVEENVWKNQRMPSVSGLEIVGAAPQACGVEARGTMKATFSQLQIRKVLHGIHLTERNRNVIISDCHIYENRGIGIYLDHVNLHQINVGNSHISYNAGGGIVQRGGDVRNLQVGNCDIEGNMGENAAATANVLIDATGGSIGEIAVTGCTIQHTHSAPESANIRIIGEGQSRPYANGELRGGNITITGNILSDVQVNIHLYKVRGVTIVGNTIWKGYTHDFLIEGCSSVVIGSNILDRNPRYHYGDGASANRGLVFRDCDSIILTGLQINNVWRKKGGLILEKCRHFNISGCIILNCDNCGILMDNVQDTIVSGCTVSDIRRESKEVTALKVIKGKDNFIVSNLLTGRVEIAPGSGKLTNNLSK